MRDFIDPTVVSRLAGLPLDARLPMTGHVSGRHRSPTRGSSLEFSEYRKYVPGDDTRRLDWRAWGRSDRFYIKEFEADTNLRLCLVVDVSGSMGYGPDGSREPSQTKLHYARQLAGTLAWLAAGQGDAVGLYCAGPPLSSGHSAATDASAFRRMVPPRRSSTSLKLVLDELAAMQAVGTTSLAAALHEAAEQIAPRALVVILSDLFVDPEELRSCFQHLRFRHHDVAVFHLLEQNELEFQFDRPVRFVDREGAPPLLIDPVSIAREYRQAVQDYLTQLRHITRDSAVDYRRVSLQDNYADVLAQFLLARRR